MFSSVATDFGSWTNIHYKGASKTTTFILVRLTVIRVLNIHESKFDYHKIMMAIGYSKMKFYIGACL